MVGQAVPIERCFERRQLARRLLQAAGVAVRQAGEANGVAAHVRAALKLAFEAQGAEAVLIAQRVIGIKSFQEQANAS